MWFDVEKERDTTSKRKFVGVWQLWFDVEKERDTTQPHRKPPHGSCGLM